MSFRSVGLISILFFAAALGDRCGSVKRSGNIVVSVYYSAALSGGYHKFDLTINNTVPGQSYPNDASVRIYDVNSFAFANETSGGPIRKPHLLFDNINGGASVTSSFSVPSSMVGNNECITIGFAYMQFDEEQYFYGTFELDARNTNPGRAVAEEVQSDTQMEARGGSCPDFGFPGTWAFSSTSGQKTTNPYYIQAGSTSYTNVVVSASSDPLSGVSISFGVPGPNFGSMAASAGKTGNIAFTCSNAGTYNIYLTVSYSCAAGSGSNSITKTLTVAPAGGKRALAIESGVASSASSSARSDYSLIVATVGTATAGVALVVAVAGIIAIRRRSYGPIAA